MWLRGQTMFSHVNRLVKRRALLYFVPSAEESLHSVWVEAETVGVHTLARVARSDSFGMGLINLGNAHSTVLFNCELFGR